MNKFAYVLAAPVVAFALFGIFYYISSIPTVQYSNTTRECIQVIEPDGSKHSCTELTSTRKHYPEWVRWAHNDYRADSERSRRFYLYNLFLLFYKKTNAQVFHSRAFFVFCGWLPTVLSSSLSLLFALLVTFSRPVFLTFTLGLPATFLLFLLLETAVWAVTHQISPYSCYRVLIRDNSSVLGKSLFVFRAGSWLPVTGSLCWSPSTTAEVTSSAFATDLDLLARDVPFRCPLKLHKLTSWPVRDWRTLLI